KPQQTKNTKYAKIKANECMHIKREYSEQVNERIKRKYISQTAVNAMPIAGIMIAAPYTKEILYGKNDYGYKIKYPEKLFMRLVNGWNSFNHDRRYVQYDQGDNKPVNDPVPL